MLLVALLSQVPMPCASGRRVTWPYPDLPRPEETVIVAAWR